jgi:hypothetical protein
VSHIVEIFLAMLAGKPPTAPSRASLTTRAERRIILLSKRIDKLTACVNAVSAMGHPFQWQHVFIPVLPKKLLLYW